MYSYIFRCFHVRFELMATIATAYEIGEVDVLAVSTYMPFNTYLYCCYVNDCTRVSEHVALQVGCNQQSWFQLSSFMLIGC